MVDTTSDLISITQLIVQIVAFLGIAVFLYRLGSRLGNTEGKLDAHMEQSEKTVSRLVDIEEVGNRNSRKLSEIIGALRNKSNGIQISDD